MAPGPRALPASFKVSPLPGLTLLCQAALSLDPCRLWGPLDATQVCPVFLREASSSNLRALILGYVGFQAPDQADSGLLLRLSPVSPHPC